MKEPVADAGTLARVEHVLVSCSVSDPGCEHLLIKRTFTCSLYPTDS